jgi:hypothetical protein
MMAVFARAKNCGPNTELRLIVDAEHDGHSYRKTAQVAAAGLQRTDQLWGRPIAILVPELPLDSNAKMRVAFEMNGPGELWLDNVKLYDLLFPFKYYENSQSELLKLFKLTHAAQTAHANGQISDCLKLLDGYWMHFIDAYTLPVVPKVAAAPQAKGPADLQSTPADPAQSSPKEAASPGLSDRFKRFVPILR